MHFLIVFLLGLIMVQSILFSIFLFAEGRSEIKTRILGCFTLVIGLHFLNLLLGRTIPEYSGFVLSWIFVASYGPFIYSYLRYFTGNPGKRLLLTFLIPLYPLLLWIFTEKLHRESSSDYYLDYWASLPVYSTFILFLILSIIHIFKERKVLKHLKWLQFLVLSLFFLVVLHLITLYIYQSGNVGLGDLTYTIELLYMYFFITGMVYTALSKPAFFIEAGKLLSTIPGPPKYFYNKLNHEALEQLSVQIKEYMAREKPYHDPNLTLNGLARRMEIPRRHLSQAINGKLNKNFNDFVNGYRIKEAIELLSQRGIDMKIFEVMYDVGFHSKSSFNLSFKKYTGQTPSEFRDKVGT